MMPSLKTNNKNNVSRAIATAASTKNLSWDKITTVTLNCLALFCKFSRSFFYLKAFVWSKECMLYYDKRTNLAIMFWCWKNSFHQINKKTKENLEQWKFAIVVECFIVWNLSLQSDSLNGNNHFHCMVLVYTPMFNVWEPCPENAIGIWKKP